MKRISLLISALVCCCTENLIAQGIVDGFYKGKGTIEVGAAVGAEQGRSYFAGFQEINLSRTTSFASGFGAIGLTDRFDINVGLAYLSTGSQKGIQDGRIYFKYKLTEFKLDKGNLSITAAPGFSSNLTDYVTEGLGALGQQAKYIDGRLVLHYLANSGFFATAQSGYHYKSSPTPDALSSTMKIGLAASKIYLDGWYEYQRSFGGRDYRGTPAPTTFRQLGADYHRIGATIYKGFIDRLGGFAGVSYVLQGRNVFQSIGANAGVVLKIK